MRLSDSQSAAGVSQQWLQKHEGLSRLFMGGWGGYAKVQECCFQNTSGLLAVAAMHQGCFHYAAVSATAAVLFVRTGEPIHVDLFTLGIFIFMTMVCTHDCLGSHTSRVKP